MIKLRKLTFGEFIIQNKVNNLAKYLFVFFLFYTVSAVLVNDHAEAGKLGLVFSTLYLPLSLICFSNFIFKQDLEDGRLELLLSVFNAEIIVAGKFFSILLSALAGSIFSLPLVYIVFDLDITQMLYFSSAFMLQLSISSSLLLLISAVQAYFRSNTNLISLLIMPLIIPAIIIVGMIVKNIIAQEETGFLLLILLGINCILVPACLILASYLTKNIYTS